MNFYDALGAIVDRLTTHTPSYDSRNKYRHDTQHRHIENPPTDRWFTLSPLTLVWQTTGQIKHATVELRIAYRADTEIYKVYRSMARDLEDLYNRLSYKLGSEWSSGLDVMVIDATIHNEETPNLVIQLELIW